MSLILDALNRADQERSQETNNVNLRSQSPVPVASRPLRRWIIEGIVVCLAITALAYSVFTKQSLTVNTGTTPTEKPGIVATPPPIINMSKSSLNLNTQSVTQPVQGLENTAPTAAKAVALTTATNPNIASLYQQAPEKTQLRSKLKPKPIKTADISQQILQQIPLLTELSTRFQRSIPTINYSVHMYAQQGAGFVTLNGHIRKTGAIIAPDLRVIEVLKHSLVLDYQGRQFRLPALNSWVNYP